MRTYKDTIDLCLGFSILFPIETLALNKCPPFNRSPYIQLVIEERFIETIKAALEAADISVDYQKSLSRSLFITFEQCPAYQELLEINKASNDSRLNLYSRNRNYF